MKAEGQLVGAASETWGCGLLPEVYIVLKLLYITLAQPHSKALPLLSRESPGTKLTLAFYHALLAASLIDVVGS